MDKQKFIKTYKEALDTLKGPDRLPTLTSIQKTYLTTNAKFKAGDIVYLNDNEYTDVQVGIGTPETYWNGNIVYPLFQVKNGSITDEPFKVEMSRFNEQHMDEPDPEHNPLKKKAERQNLKPSYFIHYRYSKVSDEYLSSSPGERSFYTIPCEPPKSMFVEKMVGDLTIEDLSSLDPQLFKNRFSKNFLAFYFELQDQLLTDKPVSLAWDINDLLAFKKDELQILAKHLKVPFTGKKDVIANRILKIRLAMFGLQGFNLEKLSPFGGCNMLWKDKGIQNLANSKEDVELSFLCKTANLMTNTDSYGKALFLLNLKTQIKNNFKQAQTEYVRYIPKTFRNALEDKAPISQTVIPVFHPDFEKHQANLRRQSLYKHMREINHLSGLPNERGLKNPQTEGIWGYINAEKILSQLKSIDSDAHDLVLGKLEKKLHGVSGVYHLFDNSFIFRGDTLKCCQSIEDQITQTFYTAAAWLHSRDDFYFKKMDFPLNAEYPMGTTPATYKQILQKVKALPLRIEAALQVESENQKDLVHPISGLKNNQALKIKRANQAKTDGQWKYLSLKHIKWLLDTEGDSPWKNLLHKLGNEFQGELVYQRSEAELIFYGKAIEVVDRVESSVKLFAKDQIDLLKFDNLPSIDKLISCSPIFVEHIETSMPIFDSKTANYMDALGKTGINVILSLSGGKDSIATLLDTIQKGIPIHSVVFADTGWEFPEIYDMLKQIEEQEDIKIIRLEPRIPFNDLLVKYSWPHSKGRWCTAEKVGAITKYLNQVSEKENINVECIGYAADEVNRALKMQKSQKKEWPAFPLIDGNITEKQALEKAHQDGYFWGDSTDTGLYSKMDRVSCACCPLQSKKELQVIKDYHPEIWQSMLDMEETIIGRPGQIIGFRGTETLCEISNQMDEDERTIFDDQDDSLGMRR